MHNTNRVVSSKRDTRSCTECGGDLRQEQSEVVCADCGLVVGGVELDLGPDWGRSDGETRERRTGAPTTDARHDNGLSTEIGYGTGAEVSGEKKRQFARLRRQHTRAHLSSKSERNKLYAYTEIRQVTSSLSLPDSIRDQACALFDSAQEEELLYGRSIEGFAAASIYAVCRTQSLTRTRHEIAAASSATRDELRVAYDAMNRELGLQVGPIDPRDYLSRYASTLDLGVAVEQRASDHVTALREASLIGGKNPSGVAAACLYQAAQQSGVTVKQEELCELADVARLTLRSTLSDLESLEDES